VATVTGTSNTAVNWTVQEGTAGGSITTSGLYTAPNAPGTFHVVATSTADTTRAATAAVTVPVVSVNLSPAAVNMGTGETLMFTASITGTVNLAVSWSIQEGSSGGTINSAGVYTAPSTFGTFHVIATSLLDPTKTAIAVVTIGPLSVSIFPQADVLGPAGVRVFTATVTGTLNTGVTWAVQEGSAGGTITQSGSYTAPSVSGTFHVVAASVKDLTKSATSTVTTVPSGFRPTGSMKDGRSGQTATLLKTGKLLVAGGDACHLFSYYYGSCLLKSSEIYDPSAGTFSTTGTLSVARVFHTATLLPDGKVLVAGGQVASAELYDPAAGTFSSTGSMSVGRDSHTATLLLNGRALIVGGRNVSGALASAEEYDPAKGSFAVKANMATARTEHTATLLGNGKVLIVGGSDGINVLASAELYDPTAGTFAATGSMAGKRVDHTATLLPNGNVLVAGGSDGKSSLASAEIYDVTSGKFTATSAMMAARDTHVAVSLPNGTVLVAGGISGGTDFTAEFYDPVTGVFTQTGSMGVGRILAAAALLPDGRVLVTGGSDLNSAEVYK
jgi:WD40 repeat protein